MFDVVEGIELVEPECIESGEVLEMVGDFDNPAGVIQYRTIEGDCYTELGIDVGGYRGNPIIAAAEAYEAEYPDKLQL